MLEELKSRGLHLSELVMPKLESDTSLKTRISSLGSNIGYCTLATNPVGAFNALVVLL